MRMTKARVAAVLGLMAVVATGCGGGQVAVRTAPPTEPTDTGPVGQYKVGAPYQIQGKWYYPKVDYAYDETGIASWYGPKFHGETTANGERFNQNALTAAHKTLPMPSMVEVTNLENGRQIKLRVNDRGPYSRGRIIDVSARAARLLGFKQSGTAKVRVDVVESDSRQLAALAKGGGEADTGPGAIPTTQVQQARLEDGQRGGSPDSTSASSSSVSEGGTTNVASSSSVRQTFPQPSGEVRYVTIKGNPEIFIQAGSFIKYSNARRLSTDLSKLASTRIEPAMIRDRKFYRVRLGPMETAEEADHLLAKLAKRGHGEAQVIVD